MKLTIDIKNCKDLSKTSLYLSQNLKENSLLQIIPISLEPFIDENILGVSGVFCKPFGGKPSVWYRSNDKSPHSSEVCYKTPEITGKQYRVVFCDRAIQSILIKNRSSNGVAPDGQTRRVKTATNGWYFSKDLIQHIPDNDIALIEFAAFQAYDTLRLGHGYVDIIFNEAREPYYLGSGTLDYLHNDTSFENMIKVAEDIYHEF